MSQAGIVNISDIPLPPDVPILFTENTGTATPVAGNLNLLGTGGTTTSGSGSTVNINSPSIPISAANGGTGVSGPTAHTLPVAEGASNFNFLGPLTNGQMLIGSSGADPTAGTITSTGGTISVTVGAGTLNIDTTGQRVNSAVTSANSVSVSTATVTTITSISVPAGSWDISALAVLTGTLTGTLFQGGISTSSSSFSTNLGDGASITPTMPTALAASTITVPSFRVTPAITTTYFLLIYATFTVGAGGGYGRISATRVA